MKLRFAQAGNYAFWLDRVGVERPDEEITQGQTVTFYVPEAESSSKPFPVWQVRDAPTGSGFVGVAAGARHSMVLRDDGIIEAWGWDIRGAGERHSNRQRLRVRGHGFIPQFGITSRISQP